MKLTSEQRDAFSRANGACSVFKSGRNQYAVKHPWRDIGGPSTETVVSRSYITVLQVRARYVAWYALQSLGYDKYTCDYAVREDASGGAISVYRDALIKAGLD